MIKIKITSKRNYNKTINSIPKSIVKSLIAISSKINDLIIIKQIVSFEKTDPCNYRSFNITHAHNPKMEHKRTYSCIQGKCY